MKIPKLLFLIHLTLFIALISKENYASVLNTKVAIIHDNSKPLEIPDKLIYAIENNVSLTFCAHLNFAKVNLQYLMPRASTRRYQIENREKFKLERIGVNRSKNFVSGQTKLNLIKYTPHIAASVVRTEQQ